MVLSYEESFAENIASVVVTETELAEAFFEQADEGMPDPPPRMGSDDEDESGVIEAREAPTIKVKDKRKGNPKGKGKGKKSRSKDRSNTPGSYQSSLHHASQQVSCGN